MEQLGMMLGDAGYLRSLGALGVVALFFRRWSSLRHPTVLVIAVLLLVPWELLVGPEVDPVIQRLTAGASVSVLELLGAEATAPKDAPTWILGPGVHLVVTSLCANLGALLAAGTLGFTLAAALRLTPAATVWLVALTLCTSAATNVGRIVTSFPFARNRSADDPTWLWWHEIVAVGWFTVLIVVMLGMGFMFGRRPRMAHG